MSHKYLNKVPESKEEAIMFVGMLRRDLDIENFSEFIKLNGGHTGGWDDREHILFQKLSKKHNLKSVVYYLRLNFPDITEEEITEHEKWYRTYIAMKTNQERALRYWRIKKNEEKQLEQNLQSVTAVKVTSKTNDDVKLRIQQWKECKKKGEEEENKKRQLELEKMAKIEKVRKAAHETKKRIIVQHKQEQKYLENALRTAQHIEDSMKRKEKAKKANKMLHLFRKKDIKFLQRIEMHKQLKEQREQEKKYLLNMLAAQSRKNVKIIRDPIRFLIPTVEWRQKLKKNNKTEPAEVFHKPVTITNIPHLAKPEWRRGIN